MESIKGDHENKIQVVSAKKIKTASTNSDFKDRFGTKSETVVGMSYPDSSCFLITRAAESVFLIDHILDLIFLECDRQSLLTCRLVSCRWAHFVTKALQNNVNITFTMGVSQSNHQLIHQTRGGRGVEELISVMNDSVDFNFPSNSFTFPYVDHSRADQNWRIDNFLNSHGPSIKKLKLGGKLSLHEVKQLLLVQATNLQILSMSQLNIVNWKYEDRGPADDNDDYTDTSETPLERLFDPNTVGEEPILQNLKVLKCSTSTEYEKSVPEICFQQILKCSPNLVHVEMPHTYLRNLVIPVNRVELFKVLDLMIICYPEYNIPHTLQILADQPKSDLALRKINIYVHDFPNCFELNKYSRIGGFLSKILKDSAASCQSLSWSGFPIYFEIPQMPRVVHLSFECAPVPAHHGRLVHIFDRGLNLGVIFPNLKFLKITFIHYERQILTFIGSIFGVEDEKLIVPAGSVRKVSMSGTNKPHPDFFDSFRKMFPNAELDMHPWLR